MHKGYRVYRTGFGNQAFAIEGSNDNALSIAEFLFLDFPDATPATSARQYRIISGSAPTFTLWEGDRQLYSGSSRYQLAYILMNEVIFHCINDNDRQHALHAGAVCRDNRCIILPGKSGNGKSTLTCWLIKHGFQYLTDELVFLDAEATITPMTRPISLKVGPSHESWLLAEQHEDVIASDTGSMIPHRLLNPDFTVMQPKITDIVFPAFVPDAEPKLQEISPAKSSLYLLRSHVNARNLQGHGIKDMASIVRQCRSFMLTYGSFDDLPQFFNTDSELFT